MKSANSLFLLIKSLTKSEKKYFKRYAHLYSHKKTSKYLKLFDHLNKLDKFEDVELTKTFYAGAPGSNLNAQRDYLFKLILKSLIASVNKNIKQFEYKESVQECEVLISKGLYDYAEKKINSVKKELYEQGYYLMLIELLGFQKTLLKKYSYSSQLVKLKSIISEEKLVISHLTQIRNILNLQRILMIELNETGMPVQNDKDIAKIKQLLIKLKRIKLKENTSYQAKTILSHALIAAYLSLNNFRSAYKVSLSMLEYLNDNQKLVNMDPKSKYAVLHNMIFILLALNEKSKTLKYLNVLNLFCRNLPKNISNETKNNLLCNLFVINIKSDSKFFQIENRQKYFNDLLQFYNLNKAYIINKDYLNIIIVMVTNYFVNSQWNYALEKNNILLNAGNKILSNEQLITVNIKDLIIHYELKNYEYLTYKTTAVKKLLFKMNKKNCVEYYLAELLSKLSKTDDEMERKFFYEYFSGKIKEREQTPAEKLTIAENYYMEWIESRLRNVELKIIILNNFS